MANFNALALFYDQLKKIVFQSKLDEASRYFIPDIADNSSVLILGGGTGELLQHLNETMSVVYLEQSSKMIEQAKSRNYKAKVDFKCADVNTYKFAQQFDCSCD